jgi:predicted PurR-regulated permease PerM
MDPHTVPPPAPGSAATAAAPTNTLAVVSLVAGIASFFAHIIPFIGGFTVAIVAIVTGFIARGQIRRTGEQGMWMANAGIIIGFVHLALGLAVILLLLFLIFVVGVALFGIAASGGGGTPSPIPSGG